MGVPKMNQKLYKQLFIAMMITAAGAVSASAADTTAGVEPVILPTDSQLAAAKKQAETKTVKSLSAVSARDDVSPALRESIAQKMYEERQAALAKAKKNGEEPVITVGRVSPNQTVELTLPKTIAMALNYNRDIKIAHYDLKQSEYSIDQARAGLMPNVDYTWSGARAETHTKVLGLTPTGIITRNIDSIGNSFTNTLSVSIPLYTGGLVEGNIAVAKLSKVSSQEDILRVEQATKLSAVEGYFGLLAYQELKDVYDESVTNLQGHVDNVTAQYNVGTVAKLDVLSSDVSLANAKTNAVTAANNVANAEANLNNILGLPLQTKLVVSDHRLPFDAYNISLDEAIDYAMKYRPEVIQADLAVREANENIGIAEAGHKPTVSVGASNDWSNSDFPGSGNGAWTISGGITYSLFDGGATNAKIKIAKEKYLAALETEQKTRESVQLQVKEAYLAIRSAAQRVEATKTSVNQAEESFKIARVRYQAGVGINLDVLDAQLNLNQAKTNNIQALYDYNVGIATLEQVMGVDVRSGVVHPAADVAGNS